MGEPVERLGDLPLGVVQAGEEDRGPTVKVVGNDGAVLQLEAESGLDEIRRNFEELLRQGNELVDG
jgi:hypothetical protein